MDTDLWAAAKLVCVARHTALDVSCTQANARTPSQTAMEGIEYRHGAQWIDEIPSAYKDIDVVMADAEPLVEVVTGLKQILNVKGT